MIRVTVSPKMIIIIIIHSLDGVSNSTRINLDDFVNV